jgi:hypothetical protein
MTVASASVMSFGYKFIAVFLFKNDFLLECKDSDKNGDFQILLVKRD